MPELPDITLYVEALERFCVGKICQGLSVRSPFVLRTADVPHTRITASKVVDISRLGKRLVLGFANGTQAVIHLMIAGRLAWAPAPPARTARQVLAVFSFDDGHLVLTEASTKKRAGIWLLGDKAALASLDPGGLTIARGNFKAFNEALRRRNHTLKRALTDPRIFDGIGNAYSDEILHAARLSPVKLTQRLTEEESRRLHKAVCEVLERFTKWLRKNHGQSFPKKVTAFLPNMAVHGKYKEPCPVCGQPVQRIVYASNETNYCAYCQNSGKLLADRALSRLLKADWPKSPEAMEELLAKHAGQTQAATRKG